MHAAPLPTPPRYLLIPRPVARRWLPLIVRSTTTQATHSPKLGTGVPDKQQDSVPSPERQHRTQSPVLLSPASQSWTQSSVPGCDRGLSPQSAPVRAPAADSVPSPEQSPKLNQDNVHKVRFCELILPQSEGRDSGSQKVRSALVRLSNQEPGNLTRTRNSACSLAGYCLKVYVAMFTGGIHAASS